MRLLTPGLMFLLVGCLPDREPVDRAYPEVTDRPPTIIAASLDCDAEAARWTLEVETDAWTGGALSAWTADGAYVELHDLLRTSWAEDGTAETLLGSLAIVDDFREAGDSATAFTCGAEPSGILEIADRQGTVVDCRAWGPEPDLFDALEDTPSCPDGPFLEVE